MATPPTPAIPPPPGQQSDFTAPNELWKWNVLCQSLCLGIPGIMFLLRVYVRAWLKKTWILEDSLAVVSFLAVCAYSGLLTAIILLHGGVHEWNLQMPQVINIAYWVNITQICYGIAAAFVKSTILLLFLRVFSPLRRSGFAMTIKTGIAVVVAFYIAISVSKILQCLPREKIWNPATPGTCVNLSVLLDTSGIFNIVSDVAILLVPVKGLWSLQLSLKKKVGIYAAFTVGIIGPVFSVIGLVMRFQLVSSKDQSYNQPVVLMWASAELATGIMIICLTTLPGLFQHRRKSQVTRSIFMGRSDAPHSFHHSVLYGATSPNCTLARSEKHFVGSHYLELDDDLVREREEEIEIRSVPRSRTRIVYGDESSPPRGTILKTVTLAQSRG